MLICAKNCPRMVSKRWNGYFKPLHGSRNWAYCQDVYGIWSGRSAVPRKGQVPWSGGGAMRRPMVAWNARLDTWDERISSGGSILYRNRPCEIWGENRFYMAVWLIFQSTRFRSLWILINSTRVCVIHLKIIKRQNRNAYPSDHHEPERWILRTHLRIQVRRIMRSPYWKNLIDTKT